MNYKNSKKQEGFIALISVVLIFSALIILLAVVSLSSFYARFNTLDYENKKVSVALAEGCAERALVNLGQDQSYSVTNVQETIETGKTCRICSLSKSGNSYTIETRAVYPQSNYFSKAYTNLRVIASLPLGASDFTITSWEEFPSYSGSCTLP